MIFQSWNYTQVFQALKSATAVTSSPETLPVLHPILLLSNCKEQLLTFHFCFQLSPVLFPADFIEVLLKAPGHLYECVALSGATGWHESGESSGLGGMSPAQHSQC